MGLAILANSRPSEGLVLSLPVAAALLSWVADGAKVVWARDMGTAKNEELSRYFKDRRVWFLEVD